MVAMPPENSDSKKTAVLFALLVLISASVVWGISVMAGGWPNRLGTEWDLLAEAFSQGRMHLIDPPYKVHMVKVDGRSYVAMPPLAGILLTPWAALNGAQGVDVGLFTYGLIGLNCGLLFLVLDAMKRRGWIEASTGALVALALASVFGTAQVTLAAVALGIFTSQVLLVTCVLLATLAALRGWPLWLAATFIGLSLQARPSGFFSILLVLGIYAQSRLERNGKLGWVDVWQMVLPAGVPLAASVGFSLWYNYARFGNLWDFGYASLKGSKAILARVRTYGLFSVKYVGQNLWRYLLAGPLRMATNELPAGWPSRLPLLVADIEGMSMMLTTPALLFLARRYPIKGWVLGAWASILGCLVFLSLYSAYGAPQFGARYFLDLLVPAMMLLAFATGKRMPWWLGAALLAGVVINVLGSFELARYILGVFATTFR